jgi:hypothetical protein
MICDSIIHSFIQGHIDNDSRSYSHHSEVYDTNILCLWQYWQTHYILWFMVIMANAQNYRCCRYVNTFFLSFFWWKLLAVFYNIRYLRQNYYIYKAVAVLSSWFFLGIVANKNIWPIVLGLRRLWKKFYPPFMLIVRWWPKKACIFSFFCFHKNHKQKSYENIRILAAKKTQKLHQQMGPRGKKRIPSIPDTVAIQRIQGIQRIQWRYGDTMAIRGYHGDTEDTCRTNSIKRNRVMKIQNLHDRAIRLMTSHFLWTPHIDIKEFEMFLFICFE